MIGETVIHRTLQKGEEYGEFGEVIETWKDTVYEHVGVDEMVSTEKHDGSRGADIRADLVIFMPPGFECTSEDRFIVRGVEYKVEGVPTRLSQMFTGFTFNTEIMLVRFYA